MAVITITVNKSLNSPPSNIGDYTKKITFENKQTPFSLFEFSNNYTDPENDPISKIKITSLPADPSIILKLNNVDVQINDEILAENIGLLVVDINAVITGGILDNFNFTVADSGSGRYFEGDDATIFLTITKKQNLPPDNVGTKEFLIQEDQTLVFTRDNFTTETTPPYSDPENDPAFLLKVTSLPTVGTLKFNNNNVTVNTVISFTDIDSGKFTYIPSNDPSEYLSDGNGNNFYPTTFNFEIADEGSGVFTAQ